MIKLTNKEILVLKAIDMSEYGEHLSDGSWTFSVKDYSTLQGKGFSAVVGSLLKKELVYTGDAEGKGRENDLYIGMTTLGHSSAVAAGVVFTKCFNREAWDLKLALEAGKNTPIRASAPATTPTAKKMTRAESLVKARAVWNAQRAKAPKKPAYVKNPLGHRSPAVLASLVKARAVRSAMSLAAKKAGPSKLYVVPVAAATAPATKIPAEVRRIQSAMATPVGAELIAAFAGLTFRNGR